MAVGSMATSLGGVGAATAPVAPPDISHGFGGHGLAEARPVAPPDGSFQEARVGGPAEASLRQRDIPEVTPSPSRGGPSLADLAQGRLERLQRSGAELLARNPAAASDPGAASRLASPAPGPAALQLRIAAPQAPGDPGAAIDPRFEALVGNLRQVSDFVVQASVANKTGTSFTSSLNKLLSSG